MGMVLSLVIERLEQLELWNAWNTLGSDFERRTLNFEPSQGFERSIAVELEIPRMVS